MRAVAEVDLDVAAGEVVGIAGPNGAGKSTLIAMLMGFIAPDGGSISIDGLAPRAFVEREGIGYLPELMTLPLTWRTEETLQRLAALADVPAVERSAVVTRVIDAVGIGEHRRKKLKTLSKGNLQRVGLAQSLLTERRVMIFDEPTHGLDPVWTARFRDIVAGLRRPDRAMLIASHNLDELERLCDRVAIIDAGRIQRVVEMRGAQVSSEVRRWRIRCAAGAEALAAQLLDARVEGNDVSCATDLVSLNRALAVAIAGGTLISAIVPAESSLEEAFRNAVTAR
ncbi:MAG: ABC transporter ATP-binding protein [Gemmatimonadaceae bacterium]|nr:ABC transporter ATP-binding protein [Gemmatimonadaceae bacterium]